MLKIKCNKKRCLLLAVFASVFLITTVVCVLTLPQLIKNDGNDLEDNYFMSGFIKRNGSCRGRACKNISKRGKQGEYMPTCVTCCTSEACVLSAARILRWWDDSVDPCEDFYNFSCGNFERSHSLPEGWESFGSNDIANEEVELKIKGIIEEPVTMYDSISLKNAKKVYESCMNLSHIEEFSVTELQKVLSNKGVGDWPLLQPEWNDCRLDVEWKMAKLNAMGVDSLFRIDIKFRGEDYTAQVVVDAAEPLVDGICDDENDNITAILEKASEHREILMEVLSILEVNVTNTTEQDIDDLFEFDFLFCNAIKHSGDIIDQKGAFKEENITLLKLADLAPQINWIRWRNMIFADLRLVFPHDKQQVYVEGLENSIQDISNLLHVTSSKVLANYLTWKFVFHHMGFLGSSFRQIVENHHALMRKKMDSLHMFSDRWLPRWRQCVGYIKNMMPIAILKEYYNAIYDDDIDKSIENIIIRVKNEFKTAFHDVKKRDPSVFLDLDIARWSHKIDKIQIEIAYRKEDDKFFDKFYSHMGNMTDSFLENGMKVLGIRMQKLIEGVSVSKTITDIDYAIQRVISPFDLTAFNFFRGDTIIITLAQLQSFAQTHKIPKYKDFSTFGWTIAHELTQGFDLEALNSTSEVNWTRFPSSILRIATKKARCFSENFPNPHHGKEMMPSSLNEDARDNEAISLAFRAYLTFLGSNKTKNLLPGLPGLPRVTDNQLFFINYAQQFCEIRRDPNTFSTHNPGRRRVNDVLKNYSPFSTAFQCSSYKPMNSHKCIPLWY